MAISDTILKARQSGYNDSDILKEIYNQNPEKMASFKSAFDRGAKPADIINEIMRQNRPSLSPKGSLRQEVANRRVVIDEIQEARKAGDISGLRSIFQQAGQVAGLATSLGMRGVSAITPEFIEAPIAGVIQKGGEKLAQVPAIQKAFARLEELKQTNPELARDIEAGLNIAGIVPTGAGIGLGAKGALKVAKGTLRAGKTTIGAGKTAAKVTTSTLGDITPSLSRMSNFQATRALNLTQGDVKNIAKSTGHEVGEFLGRENLIRTNIKETKKAVDDFFEENFKTVRSEISKVNKVYEIKTVPRYKDALTALKGQIEKVPGLEAGASEIKGLLAKPNPSLNDIQRVKELMDDHFSLYKATGDVKESIAKEGLANIRKDLKEFIEKEVKETTGADIGDLNNKVAASRSISDAIETRSTRGLTQSNIKLGDLATFGFFSSFSTPIGGIVATLIKKIVESPTIRLRVAKYLDKVSDARKAQLKAKLSAGEIPKELEGLLEAGKK